MLKFITFDKITPPQRQKEFDGYIRVIMCFVVGPVNARSHIGGVGAVKLCPDT